MKNTSPLRAVAGVLFGLAVVTIAGCSTGTPTPTITITSVDVKVWRIIGDNDSIGDIGNNGCRLTTAQINTIMARLLSSVPIYIGPTIKFTWSGTIETKTDFDLHDRTTNRSSLIDGAFQFYQSVGVEMPAQNRINIFFCGNYLSSTGGSVWGTTGDPASIDPLFFSYRQPGYIVINDGGFTGSGTNVSAILSRFTPEHEVAHYLARFNNRSFGLAAAGGVRQYTGGEHLAATGFLLTDGASVIGNTRILNMPGVPYPAYSQLPKPAVYGTAVQYGAEMGEISLRVEQGLVSSP